METTTSSSSVQAHQAADAHLDEMERAYDAARRQRTAEFDALYSSASDQERLALIDPELCSDPVAAARAQRDKAAIDRRAIALRESRIATSWAITRRRCATLRNVAPRTQPRARGAGRPAARRTSRLSRAGPGGDPDPDEPPAALAATAAALLIGGLALLLARRGHR